MRQGVNILCFIALLIICGVSLSSCSEEMESLFAYHGEGDAVINVSCDVPNMGEVEVTRATGEVDSRKVINDLYVFVTDAGRNVTHRYYFSKSHDYDPKTDKSTSVAAYSSNTSAVYDWTTNGLQNIHCNAGIVNLMAVANAGSKKNAIALLDQLNKCTTAQELRAINIDEGQEISVGLLYMSGYYLDNSSVAGGFPDLEPECDIYIQPGANDLTASGKVYLRPTMSTIKVQVISEGNRFSPKQWQVRNLPTYTYLFNSNHGTWTELLRKTFEMNTVFDSPVFMDYTQTANSSFADVTATNGTETLYSFSFLMQERRGQDLTNEMAITDYKSRVALSTDKKQLRNGPLYATMVELNGEYVDNTAGNEHKGEITILIPLGDFSDPTGTEKNYKNYDIVRNTRYTYTVKIKNLDNILVETQSRDDIFGDVMKYDENSHMVDAHYASFTVEYTQQEIDDIFDDATSLKMKYSDPYGTGEVDMTLADIEAFTETTPVNFHLQWLEFAEKVNEVDGKYYPCSYTSTLEGSTDHLMNFNQFVKKLKGYVGQNATDKYRFTVFVDEFYYDKDDKGNAARWKEFVNRPRRSIQMFMKTLPSGMSYTPLEVQQKSIQTVYNTALDDATLPTAWGLECDEEKIAYLTENSKDVISMLYNGFFDRNVVSTEVNVRKRHYDAISSLAGVTEPWNQVFDQKGVFTKEKRSMLVAALSRNRDLNRDGVLDINEIRWYIPELKVYQMMVLGLYGIIDPGARLYFNEIQDVVNSATGKFSFKHYLSSDVKGKNNLLWAEEGTSIGLWFGSSEKRLYVRMIRELGVDMSEFSTLSEPYQDLIKYTSTTDGYKVDMTNMNVNSLRTALIASDQIGESTTFNEANKPAKKFVILKNMHTVNETSFSAFYGKVNKGTEVMIDDKNHEWRIPNLGELTIMSNIDGMLNNKQALCRTKFEYNDKDGTTYKNPNNNVRHYHYWKNDKLQLATSDLLQTTNVFYVRDDIE